ncbi:hypothetical protein B0T13DRAFT_311139 [Neurospora crassa]|nr:hypothetical protein B0T13DRAFT_311139 [Neurospora crassa]
MLSSICFRWFLACSSAEIGNEPRGLIQSYPQLSSTSRAIASTDRHTSLFLQTSIYITAKPRILRANCPRRTSYTHMGLSMRRPTTRTGRCSSEPETCRKIHYCFTSAR